jgi:hypothetical protein
MFEQNTLMCNIILLENELKWQSYVQILFNEGHGGKCAYQGIIKKMT